MSALAFVGRNRLVHLDGDLVGRYLAFAESDGHVGVDQIISKLTIFDYLVPILRAHPHARILEVGCGHGVHSALLSRFGRVSATELEDTEGWMGDADASRKAVFEALGEHPIEFTPHAGGEFPYPDASFDVAFHNGVIEHVPDPVAFNRKVRRVLVPGGICIAITGTPALCRLRYRRWLLRLPRLALRGVAREIAMAMVPRLRSRGTVARLRAEISQPPSDAAPASPGDWSRRYARIAHFLASPKYNRIVIEAMAEEYGTSVDALLRDLAQWFEGSVFRRLALQLTPPTHGQHYLDVADEEAQWPVACWIRTFEDAGFTVERVFGYRYQQWLEWTSSASFNARLFYFATKWIGRRVLDADPDPERASEFILVAKKPAADEPPTS